MMHGIGQGEDVFFTEPLQERAPGTEMFEGREIHTGSGPAPALTTYEQEAQALELRRLQEQITGLQAYSAVAMELGLPHNAAPELVAAGLAEKGLTPEEVSDWLVACDYKMYCFTATMQYEFYEVGERETTTKAGTYLALAGLGVGILVFVAWRRGG
jgi:hypothetical protein